MSRLAFLGIAYSVVWVILAIYLFSIVRRQRDLEERIESIRRQRGHE